MPEHGIPLSLDPTNVFAYLPGLKDHCMGKIGITSIVLITVMSCSVSRSDEQFRDDMQSANLLKGEIALCISEGAKFGNVDFSSSCDAKVRDDFNLAIALLHSFEYIEAEKAFARVIDADPQCLMAYWGAAMSNFHPLWSPPTKDELEKGSKIIQVARTIENSGEKEQDYLNVVGSIYDEWQTRTHRERVLKFEEASKSMHEKYPEDKEASILYSLALLASADPSDKTFARQREASEILTRLFDEQQKHPGVAHYLIHAFDYPQLAKLGLPAARTYASIAPSSAHALHMPSHIFVRLGLWDESIKSNLSAMSAATCYAESARMGAHWDEELHAIDYLVYAYLQQGRDDDAKALLSHVEAIEKVSPVNGKCAYALAAVPVRFALERKDWERAANLRHVPESFPWNDFPWERALVSFGKVLGAVHVNRADIAQAGLLELKRSHATLTQKGKSYEANQVQIQILTCEAWINFKNGNGPEAFSLMEEAARMEDATEKHPVTPGEVAPARELLADMYLESNNFQKALENYEADLQRRPARLNALYGAAITSSKLGNKRKASRYFSELEKLSNSSKREYLKLTKGPSARLGMHN